MRRALAWLIVAALALGLGCGVAALYRLRISRGDVFPEYSSLRADPLGVRALHDAAALLPGRQSTRWLRPTERLEAGPGDVVFVAGLRGRDIGDEDWSALDRAAVAGARVVVAWRAEMAQDGDGALARKIRADPWAEPKPEMDDKKTPPESAKKDKESVAGAGVAAVARVVHPAGEHERRWGFRLLRRELVPRAEAADAARAEHAPGDWPSELPRWRSDLFFLTRVGDGWRVLYRRGAEPVMVSRERGAGSVVLLADSFALSNEAARGERATAVLAWLLGDARRAVFVESHLGVEVDSGVAVLARRYGLGGALLVALALAGLWIWRQASPLAPVIPEDGEVRLSLAPTAGLEALLRRAVTPAKLFAACVEAWRTGASAGDLRRIESAGTPGAGEHPAAAYNRMKKSLSHKRIP